MQYFSSYFRENVFSLFVIACECCGKNIYFREYFFFNCKGLDLPVIRILRLQYSQDRTTRSGKLVYDSLDSTSVTGQPGQDRYCRIGQLVYDRMGMTRGQES
jgi:hypothetical protein